jgi:hypothetical protein
MSNFLQKIRRSKPIRFQKAQNFRPFKPRFLEKGQTITREKCQFLRDMDERDNKSRLKLYMKKVVLFIYRMMLRM